MCLNGGPLGPQDMSDCPAGKWDFNGASCPGKTEPTKGQRDSNTLSSPSPKPQPQKQYQ